MSTVREKRNVVIEILGYLWRLFGISVCVGCVWGVCGGLSGFSELVLRDEKAVYYFVAIP